MNNDVVVSVRAKNDGMCLPNDKVCVVNLTSTAAVFQNPTAADHSTPTQTPTGPGDVLS